MPRPSRNVDRQLIQAARELMPKTGCTGLNIRQVAQHAGVNLGMFHYHFKTKDEFIRVILEEIYDEMFKNLQIALNPSLPPLEGLRRALLTFGLFARDHRELLFPLILDLGQGEIAVMKFIQKNFPRHVGLIIQLIQRCQAAKLLEPLPPLLLIVHFMSVIVFPNLIATGIQRNQKHASKMLTQGLSALVTDEMIEKRVDMAIKGVTL